MTMAKAASVMDCYRTIRPARHLRRAGLSSRVSSTLPDYFLGSCWALAVDGGTWPFRRM